MTWTTPSTQTTGTLITATIYNEQIISNIAHLGAHTAQNAALSSITAGELNKQYIILDAEHNEVFGQYRATGLTTAAEDGAFSGYIPSWVTTISSATVYLAANNATGNGQVDIGTLYAAPDEAYNTHSGSLLNQTITLTTDLDIHTVNIASALASLTGGDVVGVTVTNDKTNNFDVWVVAIVIVCE